MLEQKRDIQKILNNINYDFRNYRPSVEALKFIQFIKEVNGGSEENETPIIHLQIADLMFDSRFKRKAIMAFRGSGKSSLAEYGILYGACFNTVLGLNNVNVGMYVSDSMENGAKNFRRNVESRYSNSEFLQKMIPMQKMKFEALDKKSNKYFSLSKNDIDDLHNAGSNITDMRLEFKNIKGEMFCIRLFGVKSGVRGFKEYGKRPQFAILDDCLSDDDARSEALLERTKDVLTRAIPPALNPMKNCILWLGTPFNSKDPLYQAIESPIWQSLIFPICEKFPVSKEKFKGAWEDRFNFEYVDFEYKEKISIGDPQAFYQELMLQIIPDDNLLVPKENLLYMNYKDFTVNKMNYNYYITTDFAYSEKAKADYCVISVWAYSNNKDFILVDGICDKINMNNTLNHLFKLCSQYRPLQVGLEITGQQGGFVSIIREQMVKRNIFFNIKEIRPTKDKFSRFSLFTPFFTQQKVYMLETLENKPLGVEFKDEVFKATKEGFKSKHDDVLDTISMLIDLDLFAPSTEEKKDFTDLEIDYEDNIIFKDYDSKNNGIISRNLIF